MTILDFMSKSGIKNFKKYDGEIGIEIETETKSESSYPEGFLVPAPAGGGARNVWTAPSLKFWDIHVDGSLRDFGIEYVLKQPLKFKKEVPDALEEFREKTAKIKFIKDSITTSVHIHLNVLNESFKTLGNFLTLYTLFENLLIRYSGPDRLSNLFCLPICDAEDTYKNIITMMQHAQAKTYKGMLYAEQNVKYAALNLGSFNSYGSIEVRSFRGETDTKAIYNWIAILYSLMEYARKDINPKDIMLSWRDRQKKLLDDVFRDYRKDIAHPEEFDLIEKNVWYAASIAYGIKDWNLLDEVTKAPDFKPKQKDLETVAMRQFGLAWINLDHAQQDYVLRQLKAEHDRKYFGAKVTGLVDWNNLVEMAPVGNAAGDIHPAAPNPRRAPPRQLRPEVFQEGVLQANEIPPQIQNLWENVDVNADERRREVIREQAREAMRRVQNREREERG